MDRLVAYEQDPSDATARDLGFVAAYRNAPEPATLAPDHRVAFLLGRAEGYEQRALSTPPAGAPDFVLQHYARNSSFADARARADLDLALEITKENAR